MENADYIKAAFRSVFLSYAKQPWPSEFQCTFYYVSVSVVKEIPVPPLYLSISSEPALHS